MVRVETCFQHLVRDPHPGEAGPESRDDVIVPASGGPLSESSALCFSLTLECEPLQGLSLLLPARHMVSAQ
jgi:hypothetical protein